MKKLTLFGADGTRYHEALLDLTGLDYTLEFGIPIRIDLKHITIIEVKEEGIMRKYQRGVAVYDLAELLCLLGAEQWVFYRFKPMHPSIIYHMTLITIMDGLRAGAFATAKLNEEEVVYNNKTTILP